MDMIGVLESWDIPDDVISELRVCDVFILETTGRNKTFAGIHWSLESAMRAMFGLDDGESWLGMGLAVSDYDLAGFKRGSTFSRAQLAWGKNVLNGWLNEEYVDVSGL